HATHKSARFFSANENGVATYKQALISTAAFSSIRRSLRQFPMSQLRTNRPDARAAKIRRLVFTKKRHSSR
ncbi:MAG: hypothetical protein ABJ360_16285, partial [Roseobacter sp.]